MIRSGDTVTCLSNATPHLFPKNTAYQFTNRLPHPWHVPPTQQWCVGLSEFSTVNTLKTIPKDLRMTLTPYDSNNLHAHSNAKIYFFDGLKTLSASLSTVGFMEKMKSEFPFHHPSRPETGCEVCTLGHGIDVLQSLALNIINHTSYRSHLTVAETKHGVALGVQHDNDFPSTRVGAIFSPALQYLLKLESPVTHNDAVFDVNALEGRTIEFKKHSNHAERLFWYRILDWKPTNHTTFVKKFPPTATVKSIIEALGSDHDYFVFEEKADGAQTRLILRFKETATVAMVKFPPNFLGITLNEPFKLSLHFTQDPQAYSISGETASTTTTSPSLGDYVKTNGKSDSFYLTDGAELHLTRPTKQAWPQPTTTTFSLTLTHTATVPNVPYHTEQVLPKGDYSDGTFETALMSSLFKSLPYYSYHISKKRLSDTSLKSYFSITVKKGSKLTLDERLATILGLGEHVIGSAQQDVTATSTYPIQVNHFTYNLMVYCKGLIKESLQGGQLEPVLRTLPFPRDAKQGSTLTTEFRTIQYLPINVSQVEDLSFEIRDDTGDLVHFEDGRTLMKLHFLREA